MVAYDGLDYHGFQRQREEPTIQSVLEQALFEINKVPISLQGAGRTDAGVHALGQVATFSPQVSIPIDRWAVALNRLLPRDVVVRRASEVDHDFDPVRWAKRKHYRYVIHREAVPSPFYRRYSWHLNASLCVENMQQAIALLKGTRDFAAFQVSGRPVKSTIRRMYRCSVRDEGRFIYVDLMADGFLYKMARSIVGTLVEVGQGRTSLEEFQSILNSGDRSNAGVTAPPEGLFLIRVRY